MPNQSVYQRQAECNEKTALAAQSGFPDWAVIMCFYAALHWVNHYALCNGDMKELDEGDDSPHHIRRKYVKKISRENKWRDLEECYELLFRASMTARYLRGLEDLDRTAREHYATSGVQPYFDYLDKIKKRLS